MCKLFKVIQIMKAHKAFNMSRRFFNQQSFLNVEILRKFKNRLVFQVLVAFVKLLYNFKAQ